jgi:polyisoprenoid-binding protein YceI
MSARFKRPTGRRLLATVVGGVVAVAVIAFLLIYFVIFPTSSPKPFKLAVATTTAGTGTGTGTGAASTSTKAGASLSGSWRIASGSLAGYRVREKLAFLPAQSDAVGRTSQITGTAAFLQAGKDVTIKQAAFQVNVYSLKSDRSMRDEKIRQIGLESERYPTATFVLAGPLRFTRASVEGQIDHLQATGTFVIHGVSKRETLPLEVTLAGSTFEAVGSLTFPWSEFGMTAPSIGGFVNVTGTATMEFDLRLQQG